jgi:hypothetical protein
VDTLVHGRVVPECAQILRGLVRLAGSHDLSADLPRQKLVDDILPDALEWGIGELIVEHVGVDVVGRAWVEVSVLPNQRGPATLEGGEVDESVEGFEGLSLVLEELVGPPRSGLYVHADSDSGDLFEELLCAHVNIFGSRMDYFTGMTGRANELPGAGPPLAPRWLARLARGQAPAWLSDRQHVEQRGHSQ